MWQTVCQSYWNQNHIFPGKNVENRLEMWFFSRFVTPLGHNRQNDIVLYCRRISPTRIKISFPSTLLLSFGLFKCFVVPVFCGTFFFLDLLFRGFFYLFIFNGMCTLQTLGVCIRECIARRPKTCPKILKLFTKTYNMHHKTALKGRFHYFSLEHD